MMKILGIDTTSKFLCLGIYDNTNGGKVYGYTLEVGVRLSSLLGITLKRALDALGWRVSDIDYFACGLGPGSFTGVRVGLSSIKGLAFSVNKPIVGISTLDILAANAKNISKGSVAVAVDAKRNLLYCSIYKAKNGSLKRITPYMLVTIDEFLNKVRPKSLILGDAVSLYKEKLSRNTKGLNILDKDCWYPRAHNIIDLALEKIKERKISDSFRVKPIYLYPKECQIRVV